MSRLKPQIVWAFWDDLSGSLPKKIPHPNNASADYIARITKCPPPQKKIIAKTVSIISLLKIFLISNIQGMSDIFQL